MARERTSGRAVYQRGGDRRIIQRRLPFQTRAREHHLKNIEQRVLPAVTVLPYDVGTAEVFGQIRARLEASGTILPDADIQIAATAIYHDLELVTGNLRHFSRIDDLKINTILSDSRFTR